MEILGTGGGWPDSDLLGRLVRPMPWIEKLENECVESTDEAEM